mmetsp:Transcript_18897/g.26415  ORF Transcript_18897/g.26415 Transcript_18897/m.26415 type:complete len:221 (+) Transcript_18897:87-749(+)
MMAKPVLIYADLMSQPARAVYWFCKLNQIPHELKILNIAKREHLTDEYRKIHPFRKIPAIDDNGVTVFESHAILRYLAEKYKAADNWYPKDLVKRSKIESYLDWHHLNVRKAAAPLFFTLFVMKVDPQEQQIQQLQKDVAYALKCLDTVWLQGKKFLGGDEPSIADLSALCELEQLTLINYDFAPYPNVTRWIADMEAIEGFSEVHAVLNKVKARRSAKL